jgi:hypothetical protein
LLSVQGRGFAADGSSLEDQSQINTYTTGRQLWPGVAADADGDFVIVWYSPGSAGTDADGYSIQMAKGRNHGGLLSFGVVFTDGFESGDVSAWAP